MRKNLVFVLSILFMLTFVNATTYDSNNTFITECGTIEEAGTYKLGNDIDATDNCITISVNDVTINGNGFVILKDPLFPAPIPYGISAEGITNLTINDLSVDKFLFGIQLTNVNNVLIQNFSTDSDVVGIFITSGSGVTILNNNIQKGFDAGIILKSNSNDNLIKDTTLDSVRVEGTSINNIFLNTIYTNAEVEEESELIRQWYLNIDATPDGAIITINDVAGLEGIFEVEDGNYTITAEKDGYISETREIEILGDNVDVTFDLVEIPEPEPEPAPATTTSSSSGGGGCIYDKDYDWQCSEWSECIDGTQIRTCKNKNNCGSTYGKPDEEQTCFVQEEEPEEIIEPEAQSEPGFIAGITGAVIGGLRSTTGIVVSVFLLLVAGSAITVRQIRKRKKIL